jgi:hypothetical protein
MRAFLLAFVVLFNLFVLAAAEGAGEVQNLETLVKSKLAGLAQLKYTCPCSVQCQAGSYSEVSCGQRESKRHSRAGLVCPLWPISARTASTATAPPAAARVGRWMSEGAELKSGGFQRRVCGLQQ